MKIRRYKGPDREALYQAIQREMGPHAVVVAPESDGFALFGRARRHELIAILEEGPSHGDCTSPKSVPAATNNGVSTPAPNWQRRQDRQWRDVQRRLCDLTETVRQLKTGSPDELESSDRTSYTANWDPRFRATLSSVARRDLREGLASVRCALDKHLKLTPDFKFSRPDRKPHVIALTGPTGSGKTTTLAKLAADCVFQQRLRVGLITTDTFRVAAVDQLREYASLLDAELRVVFSVEEARAAVAGMKDVDVVFVDTPGRTQYDDMGLAAVQKMLAGMGPLTVFLTVPATVNRADLPDVFKGFARFKPDYLVVTKVDETRQPGVFTSLPYESTSRVAFVTNGQQVPQDIFRPCAERITNLLIPPAENEASEDAANSVDAGIV